MEQILLEVQQEATQEYLFKIEPLMEKLMKLSKQVSQNPSGEFHLWDGNVKMLNQVIVGYNQTQDPRKHLILMNLLYEWFNLSPNQILSFDGKIDIQKFIRMV